jgi:hypothetical protein
MCKMSSKVWRQRKAHAVNNDSVLNPEAAGGFAKISVQMEIGGQIDQLASLIRGIENSPKLLMIDEINVRFRPVGVSSTPRCSSASRTKPARKPDGVRSCSLTGFPSYQVGIFIESIKGELGQGQRAVEAKGLLKTRWRNFQGI